MKSLEFRLIERITKKISSQIFDEFGILIIREVENIANTKKFNSNDLIQLKCINYCLDYLADVCTGLHSYFALPVYVPKDIRIADLLHFTTVTTNSAVVSALGSIDPTFNGQITVVAIAKHIENDFKTSKNKQLITHFVPYYLLYPTLIPNFSGYALGTSIMYSYKMANGKLIHPSLL